MKRQILMAFMLGLYSGLLSAQCSFTKLTFTTTVVEWGDEIHWELYFRSKNGDQLLASYRGDASEMVSSKDIFCLEDGCYYFRLYDAWGDGWNGGALTCHPQSLASATMLRWKRVKKDTICFMCVAIADFGRFIDPGT